MTGLRVNFIGFFTLHMYVISLFEPPTELLLRNKFIESLKREMLEIQLHMFNLCYALLV